MPSHDYIVYDREFTPSLYQGTKDRDHIINKTIVECPVAPAEPIDPLANYEWVDGYKGFDSDLQCKGFQYEVGKEYDLGEEESVCHKGFHFCKTLDEVHSYYDDSGTNRFCKVSGLVKKDSYDGKFCARKIKVIEEIQKKPVYYNGKVVCTARGCRASTPLSDFTVGKVYGVNGGAILGNDGYKSDAYKDLDSLCGGMGWTFIEFKGES